MPAITSHCLSHIGSACAERSVGNTWGDNVPCEVYLDNCCCREHSRKTWLRRNTNSSIDEEPRWLLETIRSLFVRDKSNGVANTFHCWSHNVSACTVRFHTVPCEIYFAKLLLPGHLQVKSSCVSEALRFLFETRYS